MQAIYARENGAGTMFDPEDAYMDVFDDAEDGYIEEVEEGSSLSLAEESVEESASFDDEPPRPKGRPAYVW